MDGRFKSKYSISFQLYPRTIFDNCLSGFALYFDKLLIITCQSSFNKGHEIKKCSKSQDRHRGEGNIFHLNHFSFVLMILLMSLTLNCLNLLS